MSTTSTSPVAATNPSLQTLKTAETTDSVRLPTTSPNKRRRGSSANGSDNRRRSISPVVSKSDKSTSRSMAGEQEENPPLPDEEPPKASEEEEGEIPPLPEEAPPEDDGWEPVWEPNAQTFYFYNRYTQRSQWENPRVPDVNSVAPGPAPGTNITGAPGTSSPPRRLYGGYNPAIHGSYDPNADYAKAAEREAEEEEAAAAAAAAAYDGSSSAIGSNNYTTSAHFNRFTGRFQNSSINSEKYNDENKSRRQMSAFFDVDAAANSHDGRSLKAERQGKKLTKQEVRAFREKRREKKEEKRRAWLKD